MKDFMGGVAFASVIALFGYTMYNAGKVNGRREARKNEKNQKTFSEELTKTLEALRKKIEST